MPRCSHDYHEMVNHYRICRRCGNTQKETRKAVQSHIEEWAWRLYSFGLWRLEVEAALTPIDVNEEALEWYRTSDTRTKEK